MNIIIFGPQGSGKGTQAEIISKKFNIPHISTGDIFRANISSGTELGNKAKEYMNRGELVPDELVINIVEERLKEPDLENGFILDGFPRTVPQAEKLDESLNRLDKKISGVINITLEDAEIIRRLSSRRVCVKCGAVYNLEIAPPQTEGKCDKCEGEVILRDDDKPETIKVRLDNYREQTAPVLDFFRNQNVVFDVKSEGGIEAVAAKISDIIESLQK